MHVHGSRPQPLRVLLVVFLLVSAVPSFGRRQSKKRSEAQRADQLAFGAPSSSRAAVLSARTDWILDLPLGNLPQSASVLLLRDPITPSQVELRPAATRRPVLNSTRTVPPP